MKLSISRLATHPYVARLRDTFPLFAFILLLEMLLCLRLLQLSPLGEWGWRVMLPFFLKSTFRSLLWATLAWGLVALPSSLRWRRCGMCLAIVFFGGLHLLEGYLLGMQGVGYTFSVVAILAATTGQETAEYLQAALGWGSFVRPVLELALVLLGTMGIVRYLRRLTIGGG